MSPPLRATPVLLLLALACGGTQTRGETERLGIAAWAAPGGTVVDVVAELTVSRRRGGLGVGCVSSEVLVTPELRTFEADEGVIPALRLEVRGRPGLEDRAIYAPEVPLGSRDAALADARAQVLVHCFDPARQRLAIRWEPPGTDPETPGLWDWSVAELGESPRWLPDAPPSLTCAEAAAR